MEGYKLRAFRSPLLEVCWYFCLQFHITVKDLSFGSYGGRKEVMSNGATRFEPKRLPGYSEADLLEEIRRVVAEKFQGHIPNSTEFERVSRVSLGSILRKFGSYSAAMAKAGFAYPKRQYSISRRKYTTEEVLTNLREVLVCAGGYEFGLDFYRKNGGLFKARDSVKNILGLSWEMALEKIGAKKRVRITHLSAYAQQRKSFANTTKDDLLKELDHVWQKKENYLTRDEFTRISTKFKARIYERRFGSWTRAMNILCKAKEIPIPRINGISVSPQTLLEELQSIRGKYPNEILTYNLYKTCGGTYSITAFQDHFGSWAKATEAVGGVSGKTIKYSKEQLFDEMQRLWEQLGRQPLFREMDRDGSISAGAYHNHFGSWIRAVHAFCEDRNSSSALLAPPEQPSSDAVSCEPEGKKNEIAASEDALASSIIIHRTSRTVPMRLRWRVFTRDRFTCKGGCGRSPATHHGLVLHVDHIDAWSKGGETVFENLQTLCMECNSGKSDL